MIRPFYLYACDISSKASHTNRKYRSYSGHRVHTRHRFAALQHA